jgi:glycerol-3-phosphate dehydrogenase (NAD+)
MMAHVATTFSALGTAVGFGAARPISSIGAPARGELLVSSALASVEKVGTEALPTGKVLQLWQNANAVCFDVDCTVTVNDSLDLLATFVGCGEAVEALTTKAMDGTMNMHDSLEARLQIINCTPDDIRRFIKAHPPASRLAPGIENLILALQSRGVAVYLLTGGFREMVIPLAAYLGVPMENVFANRMNWQWDDETMQPTKLIGFDLTEPTARNQGKPEAIARIRETNPYNTVVMIGDGITDLEAVQVEGGADLFIGYGGVEERGNVKAEADWYVYDHKTLSSNLQRYKVAVVGNNAMASAVMHILAANCDAEDPADEFVEKVSMWSPEEDFNGRKLSEIINETHENPKYLPGVALGEHVTACTDVVECVKDADVIVFCVPSHSIQAVCNKIIGHVKLDAIAISMVKGMRVRKDGPQLISQMVQKCLKINCSVLMGGNSADDVGNERMSEAVVGYSNLDAAKVLFKLFSTKYFRVNLLADPIGAEMCGTLKNIVGLGAGIIDGLGLGANSKAAIVRQGLAEMRMFIKVLYPSVRDETFFECCGMGDLIATCFAGSNRRAAEAFTVGWKAGEPKSFTDLEKELNIDEQVQGVTTSNEVQYLLKKKGWEKDYPLFTTINRVVNGKLDPTWIMKYSEAVNIVIPEPDDWLKAQTPAVKRKTVELYQ